MTSPTTDPYADLKIGDRVPEAYWAELGDCAASARYLCTRGNPHLGNHIATGGGKVFDIWPQTAPAVRPTHPHIATVSASGGPWQSGLVDLSASRPCGEHDVELLIDGIDMGEASDVELSVHLDPAAARALRDHLDACLGEQRETRPF